MRTIKLLVLAGFIATNVVAFEAKAEDAFAGWDDCKKEVSTWCSDAHEDYAASKTAK